MCVKKRKGLNNKKQFKYYGDNMYDRQLFQNKILLQKTKNLMSKINGIRVLEYEEQSIFDDSILDRVGFYNGTQTPDDKIAKTSDIESIVDWIIGLLNFEVNEICYLWVHVFLVKIQLLDTRAAINDLWNLLNPNSKGVIVITSDHKTMFEFGSDSRDEHNILFDKYTLNI